MTKFNIKNFYNILWNLRKYFVRDTSEQQDDKQNKFTK